MKRFVALLFYFALIPIVLSLPACGRRDYSLTPERIEGVSQRIQQRLEMIDSQREKMKELTKRVIDKLPVYREQRRRTRDMFIRQFENDVFDRAIAEALFKKNEEEMRELHTFYISILADFHSILTPEQRRKVVDFGRRFQEGDERKTGGE